MQNWVKQSIKPNKEEEGVSPEPWCLGPLGTILPDGPYAKADLLKALLGNSKP